MAKNKVRKRRVPVPAVQRAHLDRLKADASPISQAQFRVLKTLYNKYGPREWVSISYLKDVYDIQEKTLLALAEKKLVKHHYIRYITKEKPEGFFQLKRVMITELGRQVVSYMQYFYVAQEALRKTGGVQKLK